MIQKYREHIMLGWTVIQVRNFFEDAFWVTGTGLKILCVR